MGSLAACGVKRSRVSASSVGSPRMRSITRRAFLGVTRTYVARALARGVSSTSAPAAWALGAMSLFPLLFRQCWWAGRLLLPARLAVVLDVPLERPGRGELTELVPDHRLGDEHRHVLAPV